MAFALQNAQHCLEGDWTEDDFVIATRNGDIEIWTARNFKAKEIKFVPCTTEFKDRYFTYGRCARLKNSNNMEGASGKVYVADGRLRGFPSETRSFAPFWLVKQVEKANDKATNMIMEYASLKMDVTLSCPSLAEQKNQWDEKSMTQIPFFVNQGDPKRQAAGDSHGQRVEDPLRQKF